jgi:hypothetical protein
MRFALLCCLLLISLTSVQAQTPTPEAAPTSNAGGHLVDVYLTRQPDGTDELTLIDVLTGQTQSVTTTGERYTIAGNVIVFFDYVSQKVMMLTSSGFVLPHPFITLEAGAKRVDWVIARDSRTIAWTETFGTPEALHTITYTANVDGTNRRELLRDGPRDGVRALPVTFDVEQTALYMDMQPDGLSRLLPYPQYAGLFRVALDTSLPQTLPGEPACFCGAGLRADHFIRLTLTADLAGFDVQIYDLASRTKHTIPAIMRPNFTQAGDVVIAPDGKEAIYALSQVQNFGTVNQSVETVFILIDLTNYTQRPLTDPISQTLHPLQWTEENRAVLLTDYGDKGTWKLRLEDGKLTQVAEGAYLGTLKN